MRIGAGAIIAVHDSPEAALSDGEQAMLPNKFAALVAQKRAPSPPRLGRKSSWRSGFVR